MNDARQLPLPTLTSIFRKHTAVFVDRKNYRLQNIQLSKISPGDFVPPDPLSPSLAGTP